MGTFMTDGAAVLPGVKTNATTPTGASTEFAAGDSNQIRDALLDVRDAVLSGSIGVTSVTATSPLSSTGGTTPIITIRAASSSSSGSMSASDKAKLDNATASVTPSTLVLRDGSGNVYGTDIVATSDERLKTDIVQLAGALAKVRSLRGVSFKRISDPSHERMGLIAQEVLQVAPEAIFESADAERWLNVSYGSLVGLLVEAIKELTLKVEALEAK